ncbi:hypothetical protein MA16_Dca012599 [Dendrobium catenatum]|uniref:Uncharacterized protein n=1 Tax=Dendrobium catenatum TaxID=906689 RepID=A0A2I0VKX0_9ASPA|nr:hypothetical protein MA16_Dca012599 [Dendrobium catenatum]
MADPERDYDISYDHQVDIDVIRSPFFDVGFGSDHTVEDYLNRILPHLVDILDEQLLADEWIINGRTPSSPNPASSPAARLLGITCLIVASLSLCAILFL